MRDFSIRCTLATLFLMLLHGNLVPCHANEFDSPSPSADIIYELRLLEGPKIAVTIRFDTKETKTTELQVLREWGGIENDGKDVSELSVFDSSKYSCPIRPINATTWMVDHPPHSSLEVRYVIQPTEREETVSGNDYRTILEAKLFQMIGNFGLVMPQRETKEEKIQFRISFHGFRDAGWQVVSSFGDGEGPFTYTGKSEQFLQSTFLAGDVKIVRSKVGTRPIAVAVVGETWQFPPTTLSDTVSKIVAAERAFFDDHSDAWYLVTLAPARNAPPNSTSIGGTALTNAFSLYCTPNLTVGDESPDSTRTKILLAHEYFHNWNGVKIPTASEDPATYWFSEGFTNFYARRLLLRAGLAKASDVVTDLNSALAKYQSNPVRTANNQQIAQLFWKERNYQELPYQRGDLIATVIDEHIRVRSKQSQSLDDLMVELFRQPCESPITSEALLERIGKWVSPELLARIRSIVMEGADIPLPEQLTSLNAQLSTVKASVFDVGFDLEASRSSKIITGVRESSNAYMAGLRDGQKLRQMSIYQGDNPSAELEVLVDNQPQQITYKPVGDGEEIQAYVAK